MKSMIGESLQFSEIEQLTASVGNVESASASARTHSVSEATPLTSEIRWPANWLKSKIRAVQGLLALPSNWDSYGAERIDPRSVESALGRLRQLALITENEPSVGASPSGYATLKWDWEDDSKHLEIEFHPDGMLDYAFVDLLNQSGDVERVTENLGEILRYLPGA